MAGRRKKEAVSTSNMKTRSMKRAKSVSYVDSVGTAKSTPSKRPRSSGTPKKSSTLAKRKPTPYRNSKSEGKDPEVVEQDNKETPRLKRAVVSSDSKTRAAGGREKEVKSNRRSAGNSKPGVSSTKQRKTSVKQLTKRR